MQAEASNLCVRPASLFLSIVLCLHSKGAIDNLVGVSIIGGGALATWMGRGHVDLYNFRSAR
jgi:hypothetical protein